MGASQHPSRAVARGYRIIQALWSGGYTTYEGKHFHVDSAKIWDLPDELPPLGIAVSGQQSCTLAGADLMIAVEPDEELVATFDDAGGRGEPRIGQIPVSWGSDRDHAVQVAHEQFRWFGGGWKVNAELPGTAAFAAASQFVRPTDVADAIPCGDDIDAVRAAVRPFAEAGFTHVALVQIGADRQRELIEAGQRELLDALRQP